MTEDRRKNYVRQRNAGALPWELDQDSEQSEHPVFRKKQEEEASNGHQACSLPKNFTPEAVFLELLRDHYGIPEEYTLGQLAEFKLYWGETGEERKAWQSKFKNHVIYQWKRSKNDEAGKRTYQTTVEKLTDRSWADGLGLDTSDE